MEESRHTSEARVFPAESKATRKALFLKPFRSTALNSLSVTKPAYSLRCTPDRRQREAAARLENPEIMARLSIPKNLRKPDSASPPTYEVELEMQASGLPKLRIKRIGSGSTLELQSQMKTTKFKEEDSHWCIRHPGKLEAACVSPSCFRSPHSTPGKGGGQTYICQSYTPTSSISNTTSPSHADAGVSWTPSPKHKGKTTPDAIKDWPRRKKATGSNPNPGCATSEKNSGYTGSGTTSEEGGTRTSEHGGGSSKALLLGEFELEGVYRLQDQSPPSDTEPRTDESASRSWAFGLRSRKRALEHLSPEEETKWEAKKACTNKEDLDLVSLFPEERSLSKEGVSTVLSSRTAVSSNRTSGQQSSIGEDEVFSFSGSTPPNCPAKSSLSASGLWALTQSPLLYQGHTPSSQRKNAKEEDSDIFHSAADPEVSPFHCAISRRHSIGRTYSRKKLLS
uniref:TICRR protein n=1 Tax=Sphenodon punctatus TaxID=8508 RepID=A0A8D0H4A2_SPHPU